MDYMNKKEIELRLQEINRIMQQTAANYNMLEGGKAECEFWLKKINDEENKSLIEDK